MVMIAFVGVATLDKSGKGATSILQAVIFSKPEAPVEERHTGSFLRFLRSCGGRLYMHRFSDKGGSPHSSKYLGEEPFYVQLSGAEKGSLLLLLLCGWLSLACSSHLLPSKAYH